MRNTSFQETRTILTALEFSLKKGGFTDSAAQKKTAQQLVKEMKSNESVSGRQQQLMGLLKRGSSIDQMMTSTGSSRRTIFRYLNHFEEAGVAIELANGKYRLK